MDFALLLNFALFCKHFIIWIKYSRHKLQADFKWILTYGGDLSEYQ